MNEDVPLRELERYETYVHELLDNAFAEEKRESQMKIKKRFSQTIFILC